MAAEHKEPLHLLVSATPQAEIISTLVKVNTKHLVGVEPKKTASQNEELLTVKSEKGIETTAFIDNTPTKTTHAEGVDINFNIANLITFNDKHGTAHIVAIVSKFGDIGCPAGKVHANELEGNRALAELARNKFLPAGNFAAAQLANVDNKALESSIIANLQIAALREAKEEAGLDLNKFPNAKARLVSRQEAAAAGKDQDQKKLRKEVSLDGGKLPNTSFCHIHLGDELDPADVFKELAAQDDARVLMILPATTIANAGKSSFAVRLTGTETNLDFQGKKIFSTVTVRESNSILAAAAEKLIEAINSKELHTARTI